MQLWKLEDFGQSTCEQDFVKNLGYIWSYLETKKLTIVRLIGNQSINMCYLLFSEKKIISISFASQIYRIRNKINVVHV